MAYNVTSKPPCSKTSCCHWLTYFFKYKLQLIQEYLYDDVTLKMFLHKKDYLDLEEIFYFSLFKLFCVLFIYIFNYECYALWGHTILLDLIVYSYLYVKPELGYIWWIKQAELKVKGVSLGGLQVTMLKGISNAYVNMFFNYSKNFSKCLWWIKIVFSLNKSPCQHLIWSETKQIIC